MRRLYAVILAARADSEHMRSQCLRAVLDLWDPQTSFTHGDTSAFSLPASSLCHPPVQRLTLTFTSSHYTGATRQRIVARTRNEKDESGR